MFFNELKFLKKKENAILIHTTIWINHRIIMQIERNQTKKKTFYMVPFIYNSILSTITASRRAVAWGWWVGSYVIRSLKCQVKDLVLNLIDQKFLCFEQKRHPMKLFQKIKS